MDWLFCLKCHKAIDEETIDYFKKYRYKYPKFCGPCIVRALDKLKPEDFDIPNEELA
jgi:hypothetical protein